MKQNLKDITDRITRACDTARRNPADITLIAVSKSRMADQIKQALDLGITHFGENRVQEACEKWPVLKTDDITLHLIGPLQSNKVKQAAGIFDVLHTLDRKSLWLEMKKYNWQPSSFVQVNTGEESQKAGIVPQNLNEFMTQVENITGLMCIPPLNNNASLHFAFLKKLSRRYHVTHLSMGMSDDFEAAIACGATHIRIGSALFN